MSVIHFLNRSRKTALFICLVTATFGCQSTNKAYVDFNKEADFSNLATFSIAQPVFKAKVVQQEVAQEMQSAIENIGEAGTNKANESDSELAKYGIEESIAPYENEEDALTIKHDSKFKKEVYQAITKQLITQNYSKVEQAADFDVTFSVIYSEKPSDSSLSIGVGSSNMGSRGGFGMSVGGTIPINDNDMFTDIIIDISRNGVAIWHGRDQFKRSRNAVSSSQISRMAKTVEKILAKFPPQELNVPTEVTNPTQN